MKKIYDLCLKCQKDCKLRQYRKEVLDCCKDFEKIKRKKKVNKGVKSNAL